MPPFTTRVVKVWNVVTQYTAISTYSLRRDLYIDFWMNIYDMKTSAKRDQSPNIPDINIRQYEDGHISTMSILKSFGVTGQWCITGAFVSFCAPYTHFYLVLTDSHLSSDNER